MKKFYFKFKILIIVLLVNSSVMASEYLTEGIKLFEKKKFDESKILLERELAFDPKSEKSYLYLAKIYSQINNDEQQEINLKNVLLINPTNDEALYMLAIMRIKQSDYNEAKELINKFKLVCKSFCSKRSEIEQKLKKLTPENAKNNNKKDFK